MPQGEGFCRLPGFTKSVDAQEMERHRYGET